MLYRALLTLQHLLTTTTTPLIVSPISLLISLTFTIYCTLDVC
jgi:hypothetical protein